MGTKPGWYADPELAATQRYWDGQEWTDHRAPGGQQESRVRLSTWSLLGIAGAVLLALLVGWMVYAGVQENQRMDCHSENIDRAIEGQPTVDCGD